MISNRCLYALQAMLELAVREGEGPVSIGEIAREQAIPSRFLEAILRQLKQAGLTESVRGKVGGYALARPAREITVGEVIRLIEGPLFSVSTTTTRPAATNPFPAIWAEAETALQTVYDRNNFADLARRVLAARKTAVDYAI
jgi:Rrf2 family protein